MSITDLIVELIEQGKRVEIEGIGTLSSSEREAHHDAQSGTFYPTSRVACFYSTTSGDETIVDVLAERECVSHEVAKQMWRNYVDALTDKMHRSGSHTFGELGELTFNKTEGYAFIVNSGLVMDNGDKTVMPLTGVKTYSHEGESDPFAAFEESGIEDNPVEQPEDVGIEDEPAVSDENLLEPEPEPEVAEESLSVVAEEPEPVVENEPELIVIDEPEPTVIDEPVAVVEDESEPVVAEVNATVEDAKPESVSTEDAANEVAVADNPTTDGKKKKHWWIWLLIFILLLLLAGGAYYYRDYIMKFFHHGGEGSDRASAGVEGVDAVNSLTFNCDMIEYSPRDMRRHSELVNHTVGMYVDRFLSERGYTIAKVPLMDRVRQYSSERISELLSPRFAVQRLIPYDDYIYHYNEPFLKERNAKEARIQVQRELLQAEMLEDMLQSLIEELGLQPDAAAVSSTQQAKPTERTAQRQPEKREQNVFVEKGSRQGFDLIAGFYLDKATAARMSGRLHSLGCDAYIIEFNDLYYVSMGSANSQTAADALLKHVKSWYDGDVVIRKW